MNLQDEKNPDFLYQSTATALLLAIAKGEINAKELALLELENRGLNTDGVWVGFKRA